MQHDPAGEAEHGRGLHIVEALSGRRGWQQAAPGQGGVRLAGIFGLRPWQLMTRCANCGGLPPRRFACESCGARAP